MNAPYKKQIDQRTFTCCLTQSLMVTKGIKQGWLQKFFCIVSNHSTQSIVNELICRRGESEEHITTEETLSNKLKRGGFLNKGEFTRRRNLK